MCYAGVTWRWNTSEPEFYGNLMYKFRKIVGKPDFSDHFSKFVICYKRKWYNIDFIKQFSCLAVNPITVDLFAYLLNCTPVGRVQTLRWSGLNNYSLDGLGRNFLCLIFGSPGFNWWFSFAPVFQWYYLTTQGSPNVSTRCFSWVLICCPYTAAYLNTRNVLL